MCFSPAASFIAGGTLVAAGGYTLKYAEDDAQIPFAAIPLLFGLQQIIEGVVWITFDAPFYHAMATYAYVMFSHVLWPTFLPFAIWKIEPDAVRKRRAAPFVLIGCVISAALFAFVLEGPVTSSIIGRSIAYAVPLPKVPFGLWVYALATCGACFISSQKFVRVFGLALVGSLGIAYWSYREAFYSVWCFFAAILSLIVYVHLRHESERARKSILAA